jgi:hypothetical protein
LAQPAGQAVAPEVVSERPLQVAFHGHDACVALRSGLQTYE